MVRHSACGAGNHERGWWLGIDTDDTNDSPSVHCRTNAGRMVAMKIDEFVSKANRNHEVKAVYIDGIISIYADTVDLLIDVSSDATNFLEISWYNVRPTNCLSKRTREYLSALIEEFLHTPIDERFPEKKYRVRLIGFNSDNGRQYLTTESDSLNSKFFACALRSDLKQEFTMDEINQLANSTQFKAVPWIQDLLRNIEPVENE